VWLHAPSCCNKLPHACCLQACELPIAMLACARIGAVHSVVFGGFSAESLAQRILDCQSKVVITASGRRQQLIDTFL
jgi:acetyl-CoA synthetase